MVYVVLQALLADAVAPRRAEGSRLGPEFHYDRCENAGKTAGNVSHSLYACCVLPVSCAALRTLLSPLCL